MKDIEKELNMLNSNIEKLELNQARELNDKKRSLRNVYFSTDLFGIFLSFLALFLLIVSTTSKGNSSIDENHAEENKLIQRTIIDLGGIPISIDNTDFGERVYLGGDEVVFRKFKRQKGLQELRKNEISGFFLSKSSSLKSKIAYNIIIKNNNYISTNPDIIQKNIEILEHNVDVLINNNYGDGLLPFENEAIVGLTPIFSDENIESLKASGLLSFIRPANNVKDLDYIFFDGPSCFKNDLIASILLAIFLMIIISITDLVKIMLIKNRHKAALNNAIEEKDIFESSNEFKVFMESNTALKVMKECTDSDLSDYAFSLNQALSKDIFSETETRRTIAHINEVLVIFNESQSENRKEIAMNNLIKIGNWIEKFRPITLNEEKMSYFINEFYKV